MMKVRNLLLGLAMLAVSGLVAMSKEEKQQFRAAVQTAKTADDMKALVDPFMGTIYTLDLAFDNESYAFFLGRKRLFLNDPHSANTYNPTVLAQSQDARDILDECLFQDLDAVLNSEEAKTSNPVHTMVEKCYKYTWNDSSLEHTLRGLCASRADKNSLVQKAITAAKKKKLTDDAQEDTPAPSKLNVRVGKYALCMVIGLAAIYGVYHIFFAKKKKAAESEEDESENEISADADAKTVDA